MQHPYIFSNDLSTKRYILTFDSLFATPSSKQLAEKTLDVTLPLTLTWESQMAPVWEVEKHLNVQDLLMAKASMIPEQKINEDE